MQTMTEIAMQKAVRGIFTRHEAACWVDSEGARLDALLKRSISAAEILHLRRGLFCLASRYTRLPVHAFELAQCRKL